MPQDPCADHNSAETIAASLCGPHDACQRQFAPETRVLVLTTFQLDEHVFASIEAGASGFLPRDTLPQELEVAHGRG